MIRSNVLVCGGAGCLSSGCHAVQDALKQELTKRGLDKEINIVVTGCMGPCDLGPVLLVHPDGTFYQRVTALDVPALVEEHFIKGRAYTKLLPKDEVTANLITTQRDFGFFAKQEKIVLANCGVIDAENIEEYIARDGYAALGTVLTAKKPADVIAEIKLSGLRGRGGAGFPTGVKWELLAKAPVTPKFLICNADEGDPGAFMNRAVLEGDPHAVLEGMCIGGYATGASRGFIYIRAEYPLAIKRLQIAIDQAYKYGLLGKNLFGTDFSFDIEMRIGAGAFVCGEETALMRSIEGRRGQPMPRPPFPAQRGLWGKPTNINNVETWATVPVILRKGANWYNQFGTEKTKGTKVFALAGKIRNTGLVEVPYGTTLRQIIFGIGGGIPGGKKFKAVQTGGPSGGVIPAEHLDTPVEYESLQKLGSIMGSGGMVVMDEDSCMVDVARFFLEFCCDESCGKCPPCRVGTKQILNLLERICAGEGQMEDLDKLEQLATVIKDASLCGLGQTAPNPVLSTIQYFREEYDEHIKNKYCRAGVCSDLFLSPCENTCPAHVNVPGYMALVAAGRFGDAYKLIRQENPFPAVCGRICTRPCESKCRRRTVDEAVAICDLKRFVADYALRNEKEFSKDIVFPKNGKKVAIIGAGASGLTCAHYLVRLGYETDVFESHGVAGGVLVNGIPDYRLPKDVLEKEIKLIEQEGVKIYLNTEVGKDIKFGDLRKNYDSIYIATGTNLPQKINIPGEDLPGVLHGIEFLERVNTKREVEVGKKVIVIGGGNTAIDSARTALRLGAEHVAILYRRAKNMMPANDEEIKEAEEEGIEIIELAAPVRFIAGSGGRAEKIECVRMDLREFDSSGRRKSVPVEGSNFFMEADMIIPAVSQYADFPFIGKDEIGLTKWGTFIVEGDTQMTTMEGVFAGGDVTRGPDTVISAIADGKKAAVAIDKYLGGKGILNKGEKINIPEITDEDEVVAHRRFQFEKLDPKTRKDSFDEVVMGYHKLNAMAEAMRCLHCERR